MIQRAEHNDNFTRLTNDLIRDMRLSPEAFRLLIFMLSCSDEWNFSVIGLARLLGWSDRKTKQYVSELKKLGYIEQVTQTDKKGRFMPNVWIVHEEPITAVHKNRTTDKPQGGETARRSDRTTVQPHDGNLAPIRTINIKELSNSKNYQGKEEKAAPFAHLLEPLSPDLRESFESFIQMRKTIKAPLTEKALDLAIKKAYKLADDDPQKVKAIVEQSILNSWRGLFALKENEGHCAPPEQTEELDWDEMARELEEKLKREGRAI